MSQYSCKLLLLAQLIILHHRRYFVFPKPISFQCPKEANVPNPHLKIVVWFYQLSMFRAILQRGYYVALRGNQVQKASPANPHPLFISKCNNNALLIFILTKKSVSDKK